MKAAMCTTCGQVIGPQPRTNEGAWTWCAMPCAHSAVRWRDGAKGLLEVTSLHGPDGVVVIGLHNGFIAALADGPDDELWRRVHDLATDAPGYLFDKSKRACWAVLTRVGQSNDVFFMPYQAARNDFLKDVETAAEAAGARVVTVQGCLVGDEGHDGPCELAERTTIEMPARKVDGA